MVIWSEFRLEQRRDNDHREHASQSIKYNKFIIFRDVKRDVQRFQPIGNYF